MELDLKRNDKDGAVEAAKGGFEQTEDKKSAGAKKKAAKSGKKTGKRFRLLAEKKKEERQKKEEVDAGERGKGVPPKGKKQPRSKADMKAMQEKLFKPKKAAPKSKRVPPSHTVDDDTKTP